MIKWFIERENKIPLYLQLKDLIKYYISTGAIQDNHQLPGVNELARDLSINFDTVRKAYKELEKEGLVTMKRGRGTFVVFHKTSPSQVRPETRIDLPAADELRGVLNRMVWEGKNINDIRSIIDKALAAISNEMSRQYILFTECNQLQVDEISQYLCNELKITVKPVLLKDLEAEIDSVPEGGELLAIVTTGFHMNDVLETISDRPISVQLLVTNMSPETRRRLAAFEADTRFGFICRDRKSIAFYKDLLRSELGEDINLTANVLSDKNKINNMLKNVDVLLVTPPVYKSVRDIVPKEMECYNVFERVDPMSLRMLKDNLFRKTTF